MSEYTVVVVSAIQGVIWERESMTIAHPHMIDAVKIAYEESLASECQCVVHVYRNRHLQRSITISHPELEKE